MLHPGSEDKRVTQRKWEFSGALDPPIQTILYPNSEEAKVAYLDNQDCLSPISLLGSDPMRCSKVPRMFLDM